MGQKQSDFPIRIRADDLQAFEDLMNQYTPYLYTIARNMAREQLTFEDIEEIVSDVFLRVWKKRETLNPALSFKSYLIKITKNLTIDKLRRQKAVDLPLIDELQYTQDYIETEIDGKELFALLQKHINNQAPQDKEILMRYYCGFQKTKDIATAMHLTEGALRTRLSRLRSKLKSILEKEDTHYAQ